MLGAPMARLVLRDARRHQAGRPRWHHVAARARADRHGRHDVGCRGGRARPHRDVREGARAVRPRHRHVPGGQPARRRHVHQQGSDQAHRRGRRRGGSTPAMPATTQVATAKYWAAQGGQDVLLAAHHLHGGVGVDRDYPLYRYFLLAKQLELDLGSETPTLMRPGRGARRDPGRLTRSCASAGSSSPVGSSPSRSCSSSSRWPRQARGCGSATRPPRTGSARPIASRPGRSWASPRSRCSSRSSIGSTASRTVSSHPSRSLGAVVGAALTGSLVSWDQPRCRCRRAGRGTRGGRRRPRRPGEVRRRRWSAALAVDVREVVVRPSRARRARAPRARAPVAAHAFVDPPGGGVARAQLVTATAGCGRTPTRSGGSSTTAAAAARLRRYWRAPAAAPTRSGSQRSSSRKASTAAAAVGPATPLAMSKRAE